VLKFDKNGKKTYINFEEASERRKAFLSMIYKNQILSCYMADIFHVHK